MKRFLSLILVIALFLLASCKSSVKIGSKTFDTSVIYTICISQSDDISSLNGMRKGLVKGLKDLGLVEDVNVKYIYENAKGNESYAKQIADAFAEKNPDILVAIGETSALTLYDKFKEKDIPIVFMGCANASKIGLLDKKGNAKKNITGVMDSHLIEERLKFISVNYPDVKRLGIIYNANINISQYDVDYFKFYAQAFDIDIYTVSIKKEADIDKALSTILPKVDALAIVSGSSNAGVKKIVDEATKVNKVVFGDKDEDKLAGCEVATQRDFQLVGVKAAEYVKAILVDGKKCEELPPITIDFRIN